MAGRKKNDGLGKTGGREKGTPNKVTSDLRLWVNKIIADNQSQFVKDLKELEAKDRINVIEKLMQYVVPKQQSISVEAQIEAEYEQLKQLLEASPDEVVSKIAERILIIKESKNEKK